MTGLFFNYIFVPLRPSPRWPTDRHRFLDRGLGTPVLQVVRMVLFSNTALVLTASGFDKISYINRVGVSSSMMWNSRGQLTLLVYYRLLLLKSVIYCWFFSKKFCFFMFYTTHTTCWQTLLKQVLWKRNANDLVHMQSQVSQVRPPLSQRVRFVLFFFKYCPSQWTKTTHDVLASSFVTHVHVHLRMYCMW